MRTKRLEVKEWFSVDRNPVVYCLWQWKRMVPRVLTYELAH